MVPTISQQPQGQTTLATVCISSGGTRVPIDDVRVLTNESQGTTGSALAEGALRRGLKVIFVNSQHSKTPFSDGLKLDPSKPRGEELSRAAEAFDLAAELLPRLDTRTVKSFEGYRSVIRGIASAGEADVMILTMAASDYGPAAVPGKISSDSASLDLRLAQLPKVISEVKPLNSRQFLVGFKLMVGVSPDVLIESAFRSLQRDHQDLAVANVSAQGMDPRQMHTYIITPERSVLYVKREELAKVLFDTVQERFSRRYFKSVPRNVKDLPVSAPETKGFIAQVGTWSKLALFPQYQEGSHAEFGFVAKRVEGGTLITGRASSKGQITSSELALVEAVDHAKLEISVATTGKKACLNASLAHLILEARPDIDWVVHAHIDLPSAKAASHAPAPGTAEDWESIEALVRQGHTVIQQPGHGVLILMKNQEELIPLLEANQIYRTNGKAYDDTYRRFLPSSRVVELFSSHVDPALPVLDLAAGTGEVTRELLSRGYSTVDLMDASAEMLAVAREKWGDVLGASSFKVGRMQDLADDDRYGGIIVRQAINYLTKSDLTPFFRSARHALKDGGSLVFNTFNDSDVKEGLRAYRSETTASITRTYEGALFDGAEILHGHRAEIFDKATGEYRRTYDLNRFSRISKEDFESALMGAGFSDIQVIQEGKSLYFVCRK